MEDIETTPIELTASSSDVSEENQLIFSHRDNKNESAKQTFHQKKQSRRGEIHWVAKVEPSLLGTSVKKIHKDRREHYVVLHKWNQSKGTNTIGAGC